MAEQTRQELRAYGYAMAAVERALGRYSWEGTDAELDRRYTVPVEEFTRKYAEAVRTGKMDPYTQEVVTACMGMVELSDSAWGTSAKPLSPQEQGEFILAYEHYDTETYDTAQAAQSLGVTRQRVLAMVKQGILEGVKLHPAGGGKPEWRLFKKIVDVRNQAAE